MEGTKRSNLVLQSIFSFLLEIIWEKFPKKMSEKNKI